MDQNVSPIVPKKSWLQENGYKLLVMIAVIVAISYYLHPFDVLLVCFGLGGIIFIHELGHFLAAKLCNVYVRTFSIGFGPAWPFCEFKYGETNYKIGMIPLGGFVAMAGESTGEVDAKEAAAAEADSDDPRSFKNKPVWQRMIIISAGVIMNVILAAICFLVAYSAGVKEPPAIVQNLEPGSAGWQAGVRVGSRLTRINDIDGPMFQDITPEVASTNKGSKVSITTNYNGKDQDYEIEPIKAEGAPFPQLGLPIPSSVQVAYWRRDASPSYAPGSPADVWNRATPNIPIMAVFSGLAVDLSQKSSPETLIQPGDTIVAMTDARHGGKLTPLELERDGLAGPTFDYRKRLAELVGKPVTLELKRLDSDNRVTVTLAPTFHKDTGLRMKMGKVVALRVDSPAVKAGVKAQMMEGEQELEAGDRIVEVAVVGADKKRIIYAQVVEGAAKDNNTTVKLLDPLRLPLELAKWADNTSEADRLVTITVLRDVDHTEKRVTLEPLKWDNSYREDYPNTTNVNSPVPLGPLGLAYRVTTEVNAVEPSSPAAVAGVQAGDVIVETKFTVATFKLNSSTKQYDTETKEQKWEPVKLHQWAYVDYKLQNQAPHQFSLKIDRGGKPVEVTLTAVPDLTWPVPMDGLFFKREEAEQKAHDLAEAMKFGVRRTLRAIKSTYQQLYGLIAGRISVKTMSGPITLARTSYIVAGEDWRILVLFCALISINLAVVNFLPIPVLDGGHMVFLLYEGIFRRPPPVGVQNALTIVGLVCVMSLMLFTVGLDIWRLFFG